LIGKGANALGKTLDGRQEGKRARKIQLVPPHKKKKGQERKLGTSSLRLL